MASEPSEADMLVYRFADWVSWSQQGSRMMSFGMLIVCVCVVLAVAAYLH